MEGSNTKWSRILIGAAITAVFTIVAGVAVYYLTERSPDLRYTVVEAPPFLGDKKNMAIYRFDVSNQGKKEVEDVTVTIGFPYGNIEEYKFNTPPSMPVDNQTAGQMSILKTKLLNPGENLSLSYLVSFTNATKISPEVSVRAKGIVGKSVDPSKQTDSLTKYLTLLLGVLTGIGSLFVTYPALRGYPLRSHARDNAEIVAYLCYINGLQSEGDSVLARANNVYLYSESDRLTTLALVSKDEDTLRRTIDTLKGMLSYMPAIVSTVSKAAIMMNISKMYLFLKDETQATDWLNQAIKASRPLVKERLGVDLTVANFVLSNSNITEREGLVAPKQN